MQVQVKVSLGELVDKISILAIKMRKIKEADKVAHVKVEWEVLMHSLDELKLSGIGEHLSNLETINTKLWEIEDRIRLKEKANEFDEEFIELARAVYYTNDERFKLKDSCNSTYGSELREVKSYQKYD